MSEGQSVLPADQRNVHFFDGSTRGMLGGLLQNGSVTQANFIDMLHIVLAIAPVDTPGMPDPPTVKARSGQIISRTSHPLAPGDYDIYAQKGTIKLSDEPFVRRLPCYSARSRKADFKNGVQARDGKCVFTGTVNPSASLGKWTGFEASPIFPLEKETLWKANNFNLDSRNHSAPIHSIQNGFLLLANMHQYFNGYLISANPDDNYKITCFDVDIFGVDGRILDPICRNPADPNRVPDDLLRWHFRQSILANMRGTGEPWLEHDFPPGSDIVKEIREGPFPIERFEMEVASRLCGWERREDVV